MAEAVEILASAIATSEPVVIQGDYDVDGITATALLARFLNRIGVPCQTIIPDRMTDGYGLTDSAFVSRILASGLLRWSLSTAALPAWRKSAV